LTLRIFYGQCWTLKKVATEIRTFLSCLFKFDFALKSTLMTFYCYFCSPMGSILWL
jgi:hypothetical protein